MKVDLSNVVPLPEGFTIEAYHEKTGTFWVMKGGRCFITIDTVERVWRWGAYVTHGKAGCPRQEGRGWQQKLVRSAIAALQEAAES